MNRRPVQIGILLGALLCGVASRPLLAQPADSAPADDIERMVREGMVETLNSRFRGGRTPDEVRLLALAHANKAARITDDQRRQREFQQAETRFLTWISTAERDRESERVQRTVNATAARVALAGMILSKWAAVDLDEFEITAGKQGETRRLRELLLKARKIYDEAAETLEPLADELRNGDPEQEDHYLALGVFDAIPRLQLDIRFNRAWANLYLGIVDRSNEARRSTGLRAAERDFQELIDAGQSGETAARCLLGLAMTLREQDRPDEAQRYFDSASAAAGAGALAAQVLYESARSEISRGRFEEARLILRALVEKDPDHLAPKDQPARFYINLAHLWDANSYLDEARRLRGTAGNRSSREAIILRAQRVREIGLRKMNRLSNRGGTWSALVQLFVSDAIDTSAKPESLSPAELLFTARQYSSKKQYRHALVHLKEAAGRPNVAKDLAGEILYELGVCHYRCRKSREAAEVFDRVAREYKSQAQAPQAITYAVQLWAGIADEGGRRDDYLRLADTLLVLLQSFPDHEKRAEASWWLPVALQAGGRYREAIEHFRNVPEDSRQWEEAQYRRLLCARLLFDSERESLSPSQLRARATQVIDELKTYARWADQSADRARDPDAVRNWAAAALVSAAEIYASDGIEQYQRAVDLLADFERRHPNSPHIGRVLAVRINAYRALQRYDLAAGVVDQFLRTVSPEQAGGTLAVVARGMQEEVERLEQAGELDAARQLANQSLTTFEQLNEWVEADASREQYRDAVHYGLARMRFVAGDFEAAGELVTRLVSKDPRDGNYQRLNALVRTAALADDASADDIASAREAWGRMLRDPGLRSAFPQRYWEARYHYLALLLRIGEAAEVENAIRQERVWYPELGGSRWQQKLDDLYNRAVAQVGGAPSASQPAATRPAVAPPEADDQP